MYRFKPLTLYFLAIIFILASVLRFSWLGEIPSSLYSDEAGQGYNAYSILKTGRDEHGEFLPVSLRSFGDWKPPLPAFLMIPFIKAFGLNETAVRLPSAVLGLATIFLSFLLIRDNDLFGKSKTKIALVASLFIAISPWHILQSRAAMLVVVGLFFFEMGIYFFIKALKRPALFIISSSMFVLSIYSYYGLRVITPLMVIFLTFYNRDKIRFLSRSVIMAILAGVFILLPLGLSFISNDDVVFGRAKTVSVFYDQGVKLRQWELFTQDGIGANPVISRFFHNNVYMYGKDIIQRYLSHFEGRFLFLVGDRSPPFQIPNMGILYIVDGLFIIIGLILIFKRKLEYAGYIIIWIFLSIIPAALTFMTPSSNRIFTASIPLSIVAATGLVLLIFKMRKKLLIIVFITFIYVISFYYFSNQYYKVLAIDHADWWNYGWKEVSLYVTNYYDRYDDIVVTNNDGMPYIYFLFYGKASPEKYQKEAVRTYVGDRYGFEHPDSFDKYLFLNDFDTEQIEESTSGKTLYITSMEAKSYGKAKIIKYPNGQPAMKLFPVYD